MPLITITDSFGADGYDVAQLVAKRLDVALFDDNRLHSIVTKTGVAARTEYRFDQHAPGFWDRLLSREPQIYLDTMEAAVYDIARSGDGVIIGHGSQMLLRDYACAFHVRLLWSFESRVDNLVTAHAVDRSTAESLILQSDKSQKGFFRYAFQTDLETPSIYDLTIQMGKMKKGTVAGLICEAVLSEDIQSCSLDALSSMRKISQQRKVHGALLENNIDVSTLNVSIPDIGTAMISGMAVSQEEKNRIPGIVNRINEIEKVETEISVWVYPL